MSESEQEKASFYKLDLDWRIKFLFVLVYEFDFIGFVNEIM